MKKLTGKMVNLLCMLIASMIILSGCVVNDAEKKPETEPREFSTVVPLIVTETPLPMPTEIILPSPTTAPTATPSDDNPDPINKLTNTQRNSINMLNWLAYLSQEINASSNNRLYIEDVYSLIVNETYPNAVDTHTQDRLRGIRQALSRYRMVDVKRERIEYLYEQNKAAAIRAAIPNPLTIMTAVQAPNLKSLASTLVYMTINSISSYNSASTQADLQYLKSGWDLDDEARDVFDSIRSDAFDYMVDIVREYDLPGYMTLNEDAVDQFVTWKNNSNVVRRIQFLEANQETYKAFGSYWLLLAESYYSNGNYEKCLSAVQSYEALSTRIFRHDIEYARILPLAIAAAQEVLEASEYIELISQYANAIISNIGNTDWELRYFAAETYIFLFKLTNDNDYLWKAYNEIGNNVNYLVDKQIAMNAEYLAPVKDEPIPAGTTKEKEEQIRSYNTLRKEKRKAELPPVYEPLVMNCDLLFTIANQLSIPEEEQTRVNRLLHASDGNLFLVDALEAKYQFPPIVNNSLISKDQVAFNGKELSLPAAWASDRVAISVTIEGQDNSVISDWTVNRVERKSEGDLSSFRAVFSSKLASQFRYQVGMKIKISIISHDEYSSDAYTLYYTVFNAKPNWFDWLAFWNSDIGFERTE